MVVLAFFILNGEVSGKTITVDKSGGADYRRIQGAIDAANPWDTIVVRDGTYYENIEINNNLTLKGESKESTIIYGDVKITAGNVKVMGFTITNSSSYAISCYGIDHTLHYVTIKENKIANGKYGGIYISRSLKTTVLTM